MDKQENFKKQDAILEIKAGNYPKFAIRIFTFINMLSNTWNSKTFNLNYINEKVGKIDMMILLKEKNVTNPHKIVGKKDVFLAYIRNYTIFNQPNSSLLSYKELTR